MYVLQYHIIEIHNGILKVAVFFIKMLKSAKIMQ